MARPADTPVLFADLRGGRNDSDPPLSLAPDQCIEALNVDWFDGTFARKRGGATAMATTANPFTGKVGALIRHVPSADESAAQLWGVDSDGVFGQLAAGTVWTSLSPGDALASASASLDATGITFGAFLTLLFDTSQNRSHCWDSTLVKIRREGLATPTAAPTGADDAAGALSLTRSYRVRFVDVSGSDVRRMSEASAVLTRTIVAKAGSTITRPTAASEDETHWDLEAADATTGPWYRIARTAIATTTFDDTSATISTTNLSPSDGIFYPPPSAKYVVSDQARKLYAGAYETSGGYVTPKNNRIWWTPPSGALDIGDGERIPTGYFIDVEQPITALGGPLDGDVFVFAYRSIWGLTPTTLTGANAYRRYTLRRDVGCIHHKTLVNAEDENGNPCLYFLSAKGPYRIGPNGVQYLGNDIESLWSTVNLDATTIVGHGCPHPDKHQIWWWVSVNSENEPTTTMVKFDTRLGKATMGSDKGDSVLKGWSTANGEIAKARCSVLFSTTPGASMSRGLKPHIGQSGGNNRIWKCDTGTDDNGTAFQAYVDTRPVQPGGYGFNHQVMDGELYAKAASGVTITVTPQGTSGLESGTAGTALLTASGSETRVVKRVEGLQIAGHAYIGFRIGDASAVSNTWTLDAYRPFMEVQEARG